MALARFSLSLAALVFAGFGFWFLVFPGAITLTGIALGSPDAVAEIRAFYGGMELGLAGFFLAAALRPTWFTPGLVAQSAALGGAAAGRTVGIAVDGAGGALIIALTIAETAGCLLGLLALARLRTTEGEARAAFPGIARSSSKPCE
jgi:hypothetical protein